MSEERTTRAFQVNGEDRHVSFSVHHSLLEVLREDKRAIFRAASLASKAADYILAYAAPDPCSAAAAMEAAPW